MAPSTIASIKPDLESGREDDREKHQHRNDLLPILPESLDATQDSSGGRASDDREAEHRHGIRDNVEHRGSQR
jgi:hypothetical protein